ncbi:MAG: STAS domain-containing protein [Fibrobacter sp.]|nr:STAS domain-containing protein [Fibrobacter sp.]
MKCFEITNCSEKKRKSCYVWTSFQSSPEELDNIKCWVLKGAYLQKNKSQLLKCRKCNYYLMMNRDHGIVADTRSDIATICCDGVINSDKTRALEKVWETLMNNGKYNVILDISQVNNIYSCGLGLLVKMHKDAQANNGMLIVTGVQGYALAIFTSTKLSKLLFMAADQKAALQLFDLQKKKQEEAEKEAAQKEIVAGPAESIKSPRKRIPCWDFFENHNPVCQINCDECPKKISPSRDPCWVVEGLIEGVSFQYINEKCEKCDYFLKYGKRVTPKADSNNDKNSSSGKET